MHFPFGQKDKKLLQQHYLASLQCKVGNPHPDISTAANTDMTNPLVIFLKYSVSCLNMMSALQEEELQKLQASRLRANQKILVMIWTYDPSEQTAWTGNPGHIGTRDSGIEKSSQLKANFLHPPGSSAFEQRRHFFFKISSFLVSVFKCGGPPQHLWHAMAEMSTPISHFLLATCRQQYAPYRIRFLILLLCNKSWSHTRILLQKQHI